MSGGRCEHTFDPAPRTPLLGMDAAKGGGSKRKTREHKNNGTIWQTWFTVTADWYFSSLVIATLTRRES